MGNYLSIILDIWAFVSGHIFKCTFESTKRQFYRSFNTVFGKVGRRAFEEVVLCLFRAKCLPTHLYGVESCPIRMYEISGRLTSV